MVWLIPKFRLGIQTISLTVLSEIRATCDKKCLQSLEAICSLLLQIHSPGVFLNYSIRIGVVWVVI
jgi:hypothetical protein